ncbi:MAG TPA: hypothetical protein VGV09_02380 [Steroidobacteraceae bacterium]|nr:hypothetical protein [Steroidobacteraceae bacterium]
MDYDDLDPEANLMVLEIRTVERMLDAAESGIQRREDALRAAADIRVRMERVLGVAKLERRFATEICRQLSVLLRRVEALGPTSHTRH